MPALLLAFATIGALTTRALNELDQARNQTAPTLAGVQPRVLAESRRLTLAADGLGHLGRIDRFAVLPQFEMHVGTGRTTG